MANKLFTQKKKPFTGKNESGTKEQNNEMCGLECSTVCSGDVDVDADRQKKIRSHLKCGYGEE